MNLKDVILLLALSSPAALLAHTGHGHFENDDFLHYLTSQEHIIPALTSGVLLLGLIFFLKSRKGENIKAKKKNNA